MTESHHFLRKEYNRVHIRSENPGYAYKVNLGVQWHLPELTQGLVDYRCKTVASPGFVARKVKARNYVMGALTANFRAGCSSCAMTNSFVINAVLIERAVSCWHLHQLISQTTQYLDSWLSDLLQSELKMKLFEVAP